MDKPTKFTAVFSLDLERWGSAADAASVRRKSGKTSINVSKSTVEGLRKLAQRLSELARGKAEDLSYWQRPRAPSPDALLAAIGAAKISRGMPATPAPAKQPRKKVSRRKHASRRSTKGMPRRPSSRKRKARR